MSFWQDDAQTEFFNDFKTQVTFNPGDSGELTIDAIFDEAQEIMNINTGEVISAKPTITAPWKLVSSILQGTAVLVNDVTYSVKEILDDGTGIVVMEISEN